MIKHYILAAGRSLMKHRLYSAIHLIGLFFAITTCLLLTAYIADELNYDRFHSKGERLYRVNTDIILPDQQLALSLTAGMVGPSLKQDFPAVQNFVRLSQPWSDMTFQKGERAHFEKNILYADASFFSMFDFQLLEGNAQGVLGAPNQLVLTKRLAEKYFGNESRVNQTITINNQTYTVTGLVANPPDHSHIDFDVLISYANWIQEHPPTETNWTWTPATTYVLLNDAKNDKAISAQMKRWLDTKIPPDQRDVGIALSLEPFQSIHFNAPRLGEFKPKGNKKQVLLLGLTGIFILLMAIFNYVNLATAVYTSRTREIGVRKTFGAKQSQIAFQFLSESILLCSVAVLVSILLSNALLPLFSEQFNRILELNFLSPAVFIITFLVTALVVGPLAGFYPSFVVSRLKAASIFQNRGEMGGFGKLTLRRVLTGLQFIISIGLILSTLVVWRQHHFLTNRSLGFNQDHKMVVKFGAVDNMNLSPEAIRQELLKLPEVQGVTFSSHIPSENPHGVGTTVIKEDGTEAQSETELNLVDYNFLDLYDLKIVAGRGFDPSFADSAKALIVNETAVKQLGFSNPEAIIGRDFAQWEGQGKVIGVVADFNQHSLHTRVSPVTFQMNPTRFEKMTIQYQTNDIAAFAQKLERNWRSLTGNLPFDYTFLDEQLALQYDAEQRFGRIFISFTILAIFIACLGLYRLTAIAVTKRAKEIGIRKVLGASLGNIVGLLSKEFLYLVLVAAMLAFPIAWWVMDQWLEDFAYRISIQWWMFALAGFSALLIALMTVSFQAIRAALTNPIESLRGE